MKKILLIAIFSISFTSFADQTFHLNCKLLDQAIFSMEEGKLQKFLGFSDGISTGENFQVKFEYFPGENSFGFVLRIPGLLTGNYIGNTYKNVFSSSVNKGFESIFFGLHDNADSLELDDDIIVFRDNWSYFDFKRYYKNDWQIIYNSRSLTTFTMGSANCMGMPKMYDDVLKSMRDILE
tara:strand:- start:10 stop:549 length:540 start_codon:yes stop_codon:yes gene_type:complete